MPAVYVLFDEMNSFAHLHSTNRGEWDGNCPSTDKCLETAVAPTVLTKKREIISEAKFVPNVLRTAKTMQKYVCGKTSKTRVCPAIQTCVPRCKEEWSEWEGGCEEKYCDQCCDLTQTRKLKLVTGVSMRGGVPPVEKTSACLDPNLFWGYEKKMVPPVYKVEVCKEDNFVIKPWFTVNKGNFQAPLPALQIRVPDICTMHFMRPYDILTSPELITRLCICIPQTKRRRANRSASRGLKVVRRCLLSRMDCPIGARKGRRNKLLRIDTLSTRNWLIQV